MTRRTTLLVLILGAWLAGGWPAAEAGHGRRQLLRHAGAPPVEPAAAPQDAPAPAAAPGPEPATAGEAGVRAAPVPASAPVPAGDPPASHRELAGLYLELGDTTFALRELDAALATDPGDGEAAQMRARLLKQLAPAETGDGSANAWSLAFGAGHDGNPTLARDGTPDGYASLSGSWLHRWRAMVAGAGQATSLAMNAVRYERAEEADLSTMDADHRVQRVFDLGRRGMLSVQGDLSAGATWNDEGRLFAARALRAGLVWTDAAQRWIVHGGHLASLRDYVREKDDLDGLSRRWSAGLRRTVGRESRASLGLDAWRAHRGARLEAWRYADEGLRASWQCTVGAHRLRTLMPSLEWQERRYDAGALDRTERRLTPACTLVFDGLATGDALILQAEQSTNRANKSYAGYRATRISLTWAVSW